jgi:hypothetical protein
MAGTTPGSSLITVRANDGQLPSRVANVTINSWLNTLNQAPVVTAPAVETILVGQTVAASSLISVSDIEGDPITSYTFYDGTIGGGHFELNGVVQAERANIVVSAANLANLTFVAGTVPGADVIAAYATDGQILSRGSTFTLNSWLHIYNQAPVLTSPAEKIVLTGQTIAASSLFSVSDPDGDSITSYTFFDNTPGGGHFVLNGVTQADGTNITVTAADLANLTYTASSTPGADLVTVRASDGQILSRGASPSIKAVTSISGNAAPVITTPASQTVIQGQSLAASSLFTVADANGDSITSYMFRNAGTTGHFSLSGVAQANGSWITVSAANLANLTFVGGSTGGSDQVTITATDGGAWSAWGATLIDSALHATNSAPVVSVPTSRIVVQGHSVAASSLFSVSDADGDPIVSYQFQNSGTTGHFELNGVAQANGSWIVVSAANLANLAYVAGTQAGSDRINIFASDGIAASATGATIVDSAAHPTNSAPVIITPAAQAVVQGQAVAASSLFSVGDPDGDAITSYQFRNSGSNGHFSLNGVAQVNGSWITVSAANLATLTFVGGATSGTDQVLIVASDGIVSSAWGTTYVDSKASLENSAPVIVAPGEQAMLKGQSLAFSSLFGVKSPVNNPILTYALFEAESGVGDIVVNGQTQTKGTEIEISAADFANAQFSAGALTGSSKLYARAFDGQTWSNWTSFDLTTTALLNKGTTDADSLLASGGTFGLEGGIGNDTLTGGTVNSYLSGGSGDDTLTDGNANNLLIGGAGDDVLNLGAGHDVVAFNAGDGHDTIYAGTVTSNTLSLGGGITYQTLAFEKQGDDLVLDIGANDSVTLKGWYAGGGQENFVNLQVMADAMSTYNPASANALNNTKVVNFDFDELAAAFDAARSANPGLTKWDLTNALLANHIGGSDYSAMGGDLAYQYGHAGTLTGIGVIQAQQAVQDAKFGVQAQDLHSLASLQQGLAKLG